MISNRVVAMSEDVRVAESIHRRKYLDKMEKLRNHILKMLRSYPQFEPEKQRHDPATAAIPDDLLQSLKKLATPPKRFVKSTLILINQLIKLTSEYPNCSNNKVLKKVGELCKFRKRVCCRYSKYPSSPQPSIVCLRFRPCSTKFIPIYANPARQQIKRNGIEINPRALEFKFDDGTNALAVPSYHRVRDAHEFYSNLVNRLYHQLRTYNESTDQKKTLLEILQNVSKRRDLIGELKRQIESRQESKADDKEKDIDDTQVKKPFEVHGIFASNFENFKPFTNFLELPPKRRLIDILNVHKTLWRKEIERKVQGKENSFIRQSSFFIINFLDIEKKSVSKDAEKADVQENQEKKVENPRKTYMERIRNNIRFIENVLESYPKSETHDCSIPDKKYRFKPINKKQISVITAEGEDGKPSKAYEFDEKTNQLAAPKLNILLEAEKTHKELMEKFLSDTRNYNALQRPESKKNTNVDQDGNLKKIPSERRRNIEKEDRVAELTKREYEELRNRTDRLIASVQEQLDKTLIFQVI